MNEEAIKKYLGQKIKAYRIKANLTQEQLSEQIGITQRQMSLIELGKSFPSPKTISNIIKMLNCSIDELFNFEQLEEEKDIKGKLTNLINNFSDEKLKILYAIAKNI